MKHVFLPEARADMRRLHAFLDENNPRAAEDAMSAIERSLSMLEANPLMGRPLRGGMRLRELVIPFGRGAYIMHYRPGDDALVVTRIWHGREDRGTA